MAESKPSLSAEEGPRPPAADLPRPLVLSVDDQPETRAFIVGVLQKRFRVASASDGVEGLARALELRPDLILTDLRMPRMDGEELVRAIRQEPTLEGIPVVLLTAWADDEVRVRMLKEGALDYITKPFSSDELLSRVANLIALKRAREVLQEELQSRNRDLDALAAEVVLRKRELKAALETAQLERDRAERASLAKSSFLGLVSHELMTPVAALRLTCQRLERDRENPLAPRHLELVQRMVAMAGRLAGEIGAILEHVRVECGPPRPRCDAVDLAALAREVLEELRPQADEKGLELSLVAPAELPPVTSDERLVRIVLANLVSNAVKFTPHGSVAVTLTHGRGAHRVAVRDTGPGIPAHERQRIFEPFQQLEPLLRKHEPGIGLGLALVKELTAALGGRIELDPGEGPGSTFTLVLPEPGGQVVEGGAPAS
ncbi:MAG TPA: hybrid sensor histidine kinase/response regulator [Anaeromyxobacteraceae bacterium]|nr:hybrid sensor histidine kinase/response regulator [Anaeromyxobacteraceae bacterium]